VRNLSIDVNGRGGLLASIPSGPGASGSKDDRFRGAWSEEESSEREPLFLASLVGMSI